MVPKGWDQSRGKRVGYKFELPELEPGGYLIEIASKMGYCKRVGADVAALTDMDIWYFKQNRGIRLDEWEVELIIEISRGFIEGWDNGSDEFGTPPMEMDQ